MRCGVYLYWLLSLWLDLLLRTYRSHNDGCWSLFCFSIEGKWLSGLAWSAGWLLLEKTAPAVRTAAPTSFGDALATRRPHRVGLQGLIGWIYVRSNRILNRSIRRRVLSKAIVIKRKFHITGAKIEIMTVGADTPHVVLSKCFWFTIINTFNNEPIEYEFLPHQNFLVYISEDTD